MKVTQEKLPNSQIGIDIEIPPEKSKTAYEQVIRNYAKNANIPGFRRGKVPRQILVQRLGAERIKATVLDELMQECLPKAVEQENIEPIGEFELRGDVDQLVQQFQPGQPITIQAAVDVKPEANLETYTGWTVQAEEVAYDPEQVNTVLEQERAKLATLIPIEDRPAQEGDVAFIDFKGVFADGAEGEEPTEIPGGQAENFEVLITEGQFIPGFTEGIVGMNPGETKELSLSFPEDYGNEDLAGQAAVFTITLNEIKEKELPELDDDFAQEASEFETIAELRESLEKRYREEAEEKTRANKETALAKALVEAMEVELPETMIRQEVDQMLTQQAMQLSQMGIDVKQFFTSDMVPKMRENARPEAIQQLKKSLGIQHVAKKESITVEEEEIKAESAKILEQLKDQEVDPQRLREVVENDLTTKKAFAWLEEHSTVELVPEGTLSESEDGEVTGEGEMVTDEVSAETATVDVEAVDSSEEE